MSRTSLMAAAVALPLLALSSQAQATSDARGCALTDRTAWTATRDRADRVIRDTDRMLRRTGDRLFNWGDRHSRASR
jgi:hypothetical protein